MISKLIERMNIFLKTKVELYHLNNIPIGVNDYIPSFWEELFNSNLKIDQIIHQIWLPIGEIGEEVNRVIKMNCIDLCLLFLPEIKTVSLCYIYNTFIQNQMIFHCWIGNLPCEDPEKHALNQRIVLPSSYKKLLKVHNGFTVEGNRSMGFCAIDELTLIPSIDTLGCSSNNKEKNLLAFCNNGMGDKQCYDFLQPKSDDDFFTVFWDHETKKSYDQKDFKEFFLEYISDVMKINK